LNKATKELFDAACKGDTARAEIALKTGAEINFVDHVEETPLSSALSCWELTGEPLLNIVRFLLAHGANPNFRDRENCGVMHSAALRENPCLMEMLILAGAEVNFFFDSGESLYDVAEFDYRYEHFALFLPFEPTEIDRATEDSWLDFLDHCADRAEKKRPEHLRVMRKYGAKSAVELKKVGIEFDTRNEG